MNIYDELIKIGWYPDRKVDFEKYTKITIPNKIRNFVENFGDLKYFNQDCLYLFRQCIKKFTNNDIEQYSICSLMSDILGNLKITMTENEEFYILEYNRKIADSIEDFFTKMFSGTFDLSIQFSENFWQRLKECGWYPNRKVDISNFTNTLKEYGYVLFDKVYEFYNEYYGLQGSTLHYDMPFKILDEYDILEYYKDYENYIGYLSYFNYRLRAKTLFPICIIYFEDDISEFYITDTGEVYRDDGELVGTNFTEGLNSILRI